MRRAADPVCSVDGCDGKTYCRGWCSYHYGWAKRHGWDPIAPGRRAFARDFFIANVCRITDECIVWPFALDRKGYGVLTLAGRKRCVHAWACQIWHGDPPAPGMIAGHGPCHNPACFNGQHLSWLTPQQNVDDRRRDGTETQGTGVWTAKLTETDVLAIRERALSNESRASLAAAFGVDKNSIRTIVNGTTWKHLL